MTDLLEETAPAAGTPFVTDELRAGFEALTLHDQVVELSNRVGSYYDVGTPDREYRFLRQVEELLGIVADRTAPAGPDDAPVDDRLRRAAGEGSSFASDALAEIERLRRELEEVRLSHEVERMLRSARTSGEGVTQPDWNAVWREASVMSGYYRKDRPDDEPVTVRNMSLRLLDEATHDVPDVPVFADWNGYDVVTRWLARLHPENVEGPAGAWFSISDREARDYRERWGGDEAPSGRMEIALFVHGDALAEAKAGRERAEREAGRLALRLRDALRGPRGEARAGTKVPTPVEAFGLGYEWRSMLVGQTLEDSRAVGRTLCSDLFDGIGLDLDDFDSFASADHGIEEGLARIRRALSSGASAEAPGWLLPYRTIDASGGGEAAGTVGWRWLDGVAQAERDRDPEGLSIETPPRAGGDALGVLYRGPRPIALYFVFRDPMNYAVLMRWRIAVETVAAPVPERRSED